MPLLIDRFAGEFRFLSNFFIEPDGTCVEHEFQAAKTDDVDWQRRIFAADSPGKAKRLGRKAPLRADWEAVKVDVMHDLLIDKFGEHEALYDLLIATHPAVLIERNDWHDTFWGVCNGKCRQGPHPPFGDNNLGKLLVEVRNELRR
jgi:ribA/ribD-fused uncharacterized protein